MKTPITYARIERLYPGGTAVCFGTGPSLTQADVDRCRGRVDLVIAVNEAVKLAPWADVLYAHDDKWWKWHHGMPAFRGLKYSGAASPNWGVPRLTLTGETGIETDPTGLRHGKTSGYQAINLAVHFGVKTILLLGYDMKGDHFFGSYVDRSKPPFLMCLSLFQTMVEPLRALGVEIINCTPNSALTCFPRMPLDQALARERELCAP